MKSKARAVLTKVSFMEDFISKICYVISNCYTVEKQMNC